MARQKEFHWYEGLALFLSCIAIQLMSEVFAQWGAFFYSPGTGAGRIVYVSIGLAGAIFTIGLVLDGITNPIIGLLSDRTQTRPSRWRIIPISGRRRPFIFWGSIGLVFTSVLFWYPPVQHESNLNFIYGTCIYAIHSAVLFNICVIPFNSLAPEIARSQEARVKIGTWIAAGMIVGLATAEIAPGILVKQLDPARRVDVQAAAQRPAATPEQTAVISQGSKIGADEAKEERLYSPVGYQRTALLFALVSLAFLQLTVWCVRERYDSALASASTPPWRVMKQAFGNRVFIKYLAIFFLFNIGFLAVQRILPYWVQIGLHGEEDLVSLLMGPFIVTALAALALTQLLVNKIPVKWLLFMALSLMAVVLPFMYFIAASELSTSVKTLLGACLFGLCGIGQGMLYVLFTPLLGEIIDLDEKATGERREAVYGGLSGLAWKASQALSVLFATQCMRVLGNSPEQPMGVYLIGPLASVFTILGLAVCWTYPVLHVTKESMREEAELEGHL